MREIKKIQIIRKLLIFFVVQLLNQRNTVVVERYRLNFWRKTHKEIIAVRGVALSWYKNQELSAHISGHILRIASHNRRIALK